LQAEHVTTPKISVVVCARNEEPRIEACLRSIAANNPDEILVVDGRSEDRTAEIAEAYATRVIRSDTGSLSRDRQVGIDASVHDHVALIDADHRLSENDLVSLQNDLIEFSLDIVQSQLKSYRLHGFWDSAEDAAWDLTHNIPGPKAMIGVAPALFKKGVFTSVRFDDHITKTIDDTDFMYRLSQVPGLKVGIGRTVVRQDHFSDFRSYVEKFAWYGKGDGEFCRKHPNRALSMLYHLLIRYPVVYSIKALRGRKARAVPFFILQGVLRFRGLLRVLLT
jgi:glycosyltransferase involved in cell wall biosynthesis